jgi:hypothetical protein
MTARTGDSGWVWERRAGGSGPGRLLTEQATDGGHSLEEGLGEAGTEAQCTAVGQPQDDWPVLWPKEEAGIGQNPIFVQCPVCL